MTGPWLLRRLAGIADRRARFVSTLVALRSADDPEPLVAVGRWHGEILAAPSTEELVLGVYEKAVPAVKAALEKHLTDTNHLADQPSVRLCRIALMDVEDE